MEVLSGNPHLYLNYAPFNAPGSLRPSNVTFPSRSNNWMNATDPNFPVLRIEGAMPGHYVLAVVPAASSKAQADWKVTMKRGFGQVPQQYVDPTILHDGVKASDWLWHNSSNYHLIRIPQYERGPRGERLYNEVRVSLTSWYGDAELFVSTSRSPFDLPGLQQLHLEGVRRGHGFTGHQQQRPRLVRGLRLVHQRVQQRDLVLLQHRGHAVRQLLLHPAHQPPAHQPPHPGQLHAALLLPPLQLRDAPRLPRAHLTRVRRRSSFSISVVLVSDYVGQALALPRRQPQSSTARVDVVGLVRGQLAVHVKHASTPAFCDRSWGSDDTSRSRPTTAATACT